MEVRCKKYLHTSCDFVSFASFCRLRHERQIHTHRRCGPVTVADCLGIDCSYAATMRWLVQPHRRDACWAMLALWRLTAARQLSMVELGDATLALLPGLAPSRCDLSSLRTPQLALHGAYFWAYTKSSRILQWFAHCSHRGSVHCSFAGVSAIRACSFSCLKKAAPAGAGSTFYFGIFT